MCDWELSLQVFGDKDIHCKLAFRMRKIYDSAHIAVTIIEDALVEKQLAGASPS